MDEENKVLKLVPEESQPEPFDVLIEFKEGSSMKISDVVDFGFPDGNFSVLFVSKGDHNLLFNMDVVAYIGRMNDFTAE